MTSHICPIREVFFKYEHIDTEITGIGNAPVRVIGCGSIKIKFFIDGKETMHTLKDVLHAPSAANGLVSVGRFDSTGGRSEFYGGKCYLKDNNGKLMGTGNLKQKIYLLKARAEIANKFLQEVKNKNKTFATNVKKPTWAEWHRRYGHLSIGALMKLKKCDMVTGLEVTGNSPPTHDCEACIQAKQTRRPFPKEAKHRSSTPGERSVTDVWGPAQVRSIGRWSYYISFTDDCTRMCHVLFLRTKDEAFERIQQYIMLIKNKYDRKPKVHSA